MYSEIDDMFPDTESYLTPPAYMGGCYGDEGNEVMKEIELMGYDIEDEDFLMSGPFKRLFRRIQKRIRARRSARAKKEALSELGPASEQQVMVAPPVQQPSFQLQTTKGAFGYGPGGFTYIKDPKTGQPVPVSPTGQVGASTAGFMQNPMAAIQRNPMLLAIPAGLLVFAMLMKNK